MQASSGGSHALHSLIPLVAPALITHYAAASDRRPHFSAERLDSKTSTQQIC